MVEGNPLRCSAVTIRRAAFEDVGGFDPSLRYVLDWDFWLRVSRRWKVAWLARPSVSVRWHGASETHRFKTGTADLEESARMLETLFSVDLKDRPGRRSTAADRDATAGPRLPEPGPRCPACRSTGPGPSRLFVEGWAWLPSQVSAVPARPTARHPDGGAGAGTRGSPGDSSGGPIEDPSSGVRVSAGLTENGYNDRNEHREPHPGTLLLMTSPCSAPITEANMAPTMLPVLPVVMPELPHLPASRAEMEARGWDCVDVVFVTGDAYVDHPAFAMGILGRVLEAAGFRVAILSQPDWRSAEPWRTVRPASAVLRHQRRQHGQHDQPLHGQQEGPQRRRLLAPAAGSASGPTAPPCPTASGPARRSPACR